MFPYSLVQLLCADNCSSLLMLLHKINKIYILTAKLLHSKTVSVWAFFFFFFSSSYSSSSSSFSFIWFQPLSSSGLGCYYFTIWSLLQPGIHLLLASTWANLLSYKSKELVGTQSSVTSTVLIQYLRVHSNFPFSSFVCFEIVFVAFSPDIIKISVIIGINSISTHLFFFLCIQMNY